jgi:hypothetical protein
MRHRLKTRQTHAILLVASVLLVASCESPARVGQQARAVVDSDGDGVWDHHDQCPGTSTERVNAAGCPDQDLDGVYDEDDLCPGTEERLPVDRNGCRSVGPDVGTGGQVRRPRYLTAFQRLQIVRQLFPVGLPVVCQDDHVPPPAPRVTSPAPWSALLDQWFNNDPHVTISWSAVSDPCQPVTYGIEFQGKDYLGPGGWDAVERHDQLSATSITIEWPDGSSSGRYRVWARDANGAQSEFSAWRYFVFPTSDKPTSPVYIAPPDY